MADVTHVLSAIEAGDPHAAEQLLPLVYEELRKLAATELAQESPGQTLQATALVHDAYIRLVDVEKVQHWNSRGHFFAAAAEAMRRILVDIARRKASAKRGGAGPSQSSTRCEIVVDDIPEDLVALNEALTKLAATDNTAAELVQFRFFAGLALPEYCKNPRHFSSRTAGPFLGLRRAWLHPGDSGARSRRRHFLKSVSVIRPGRFRTGEWEADR